LKYLKTRKLLGLLVKAMKDNKWSALFRHVIMCDTATNGVLLHKRTLNLRRVGGGGGGEGAAPCFGDQILNMFPRFPMCSPRVFPIAPHFNPVCFAQSPPLLIYIGGLKEEALYLSIKKFILGSLHSFSLFFCDGPIKLAHCPQKKSWTCEAPPTN
jgi:hypothetical protein